MKNPLEELGEEFNPTKRYHDYLRHYRRRLRDTREDVQRVCEIIAQFGSAA